MYNLKHLKFYQKKADMSKGLFKACWADLLEDIAYSGMNFDDDEDVMDYLNYRAEVYVNDPDSEYYLYG